MTILLLPEIDFLCILTAYLSASVAELADATDSKSVAPCGACRFDSGQGHHFYFNIMDHTIRLATLKDAEAIAKIHVACWLETYTGIIPDSYLSRLSIKEKYEMWLKAFEQKRPIYVAEVDGKLVGFANGGKSRSTESHYSGELYTLYVLKQFHCLGIGKHLFNSVQQYLKTNDLFPFIALVLEKNPSLGFYKHIGAEIIGEYIEDFDGVKLKELKLLCR